MNSRLITYYSKVAALTAELSRSQKLKVGAIVVRQNRIISIGYNGTPAGWDNTCETKEYMDPGAPAWLDSTEVMQQWPLCDSTGRYRWVTLPHVIHAERNALDKLGGSNESGAGAALFCTHAPCLECAKSIFTAGIHRVYYQHHYCSAMGDGLKFLQDTDVHVEQFVP